MTDIEREKLDLLVLEALTKLSSIVNLSAPGRLVSHSRWNRENEDMYDIIVELHRRSERTDIATPEGAASRAPE